jgi:glycosyltransferase involved in cell wall biosynthesis
MKVVKVLFFNPNQFYGSIVSVFSQIIRHLDRARFQPYLILNREARGVLPVRAADGVIIQHWTFGTGLRASPIAGLRSVARLPLTMLQLARYARREGVDIVQCSPTPLAGTLGLALAKLVGARLIAHCQVMPGDYGAKTGRGGARTFFQNTILRQAHHVVAISDYMAAHLRAAGIPAAKLDVVTNGADLDTFNPEVDGAPMRQAYGIPAEAPLILQIARLAEQKRQEDLLRAFALARKRVPGLRCLLIGSENTAIASGPFPTYMAKLRHICEQEQLGDSVSIAPARSEAPLLMAAADIVVMPSVEEPWGLVVTEAMAAGKPVIGAASGGIPEQIVDGETGFLVPPRSPEALAEKLVALAQDPDLRVRMGRAARRRAEICFDQAQLAVKFAAIYEALVAVPPKGER